jgi:hypothetical protein
MRRSAERLPDARPSDLPPPPPRAPHGVGIPETQGSGRSSGSAASRGRRLGDATVGLLWILLAVDLSLLAYLLVTGQA